MTDGQPTPPAHDGMACFRGRSGKLRLVRNHEVRTRRTGDRSPRQGVRPQRPGRLHDPRVRHRQPARRPPTGVPSWAPSAARMRTARAARRRRLVADVRGDHGVNRTVQHGYVFDVPSATPLGEPVKAEPILGMGLFAHEATASDPRSVRLPHRGRRHGRPVPLRPQQPRRLLNGGEAGDAEGRRRSVPHVDRPERRTPLPTSWVPIADPNPLPYAQGTRPRWCRRSAGWRVSGGARSTTSSTSPPPTAATRVGGPDLGVLAAPETLTLIYQSPDTATLLKPDNITVSPHGQRLDLRGSPIGPGSRPSRARRRRHACSPSPPTSGTASSRARRRPRRGTSSPAPPSRPTDNGCS